MFEKTIKISENFQVYAGRHQFMYAGNTVSHVGTVYVCGGGATVLLYLLPVCNGFKQLSSKCC